MNDRNVSRELVHVDGRFFIIEGCPADGYDVWLCRVEHVGHHRRKWEARAAVHGDGAA